MKINIQKKKKQKNTTDLKFNKDIVCVYSNRAYLVFSDVEWNVSNKANIFKSYGMKDKRNEWKKTWKKSTKFIAENKICHITIETNRTFIQLEIWNKFS